MISGSHNFMIVYALMMTNPTGEYMNTERQMEITLADAVMDGDYRMDKKLSIRENFDAYQIKMMARKASNAHKPKDGPQSRVFSEVQTGAIQATLGKRYRVHKRSPELFALTKIVTDNNNIRHTTIPVSSLGGGLKQRDVVRINCEFQEATNRLNIIEVHSVEKV